MDSYQQLLSTLALTMGVGWASGINLYAAVLMLGLMGVTGNITLPPDLQVLTNPLVIGAAGLMYFVEFVVDKTPGADSAWDSLHTFVRIPAGAILAAHAVGDVNSAAVIASGLMGGGLATVSHATKAGSRLVINTSPEPVSNWAASLTEDLAVFAGLWAALHHPVLFLGLLALFLVFVAWLLPRLGRVLKGLWQRLARWFGGGGKEPPQES